MKLALKFDASGFGEWADRMGAMLRSDEGAFADALADASDYYHEAMRKRFIDASYGDGTWVKLRPRTVKAHARIGDFVPTILHFHGDLEKSLYRGDARHVFTVGEGYCVEGSIDKKAAYHQNGTDRIPARPIYVYPGNETLAMMRARLGLGLSGANAVIRINK